MSANADIWGLLGITLRPRRDSRESYADDVDRLAELASLLAALDGVGGVETQDQDTFGAPERPRLLVYTDADALQGLEPTARVLAERLGLAVEIEARTHDGDDWRDAWKRFYRPLRYGSGSGSGPGLLIRPSWIARESDDPELEIVLDPGRAFGTGLHASTQLCLRWLCQTPGLTGPALDLGCGSGILALAAARLLDTSVLAVDLDPEATETTAENAAINGLERRVRILCGTLEDVIDGPFATVIANIRPEVLIPAAPLLWGRLAPGGRGVLSGILEEEADEVRDAYASVGARVSTFERLDGWAALGLERPPA